mmetsp:Transcript_38169/g.99474  ORF Transcript_38169/g.99474 Transcript_38169/m.99474 type:complete len:212 (-) Transcript_38169:81-716(-)
MPCQEAAGHASEDGAQLQPILGRLIPRRAGDPLFRVSRVLHLHAAAVARAPLRGPAARGAEPAGAGAGAFGLQGLDVRLSRERGRATAGGELPPAGAVWRRVRHGTSQGGAARRRPGGLPGGEGGRGLRLRGRGLAPSRLPGGGAPGAPGAPGSSAIPGGRGQPGGAAAAGGKRALRAGGAARRGGRAAGAERGAAQRGGRRARPRISRRA